MSTGDIPPVRIFCQIQTSVDQQQWINQQLPDEEIVFGEDLPEDEAKEAFGECEVCLGNPPLTWVEDSKSLRWMQLDSAGLDPYLDIIKAGKVQVSNMKDFFSKPVAETAVGGILMLYRKLHTLYTAQGEKRWVYHPVRNQCDTIQGKSILILGAGSIGRMVGDYLAPFGGRISFYTRRSIDDVHTTDSLPSALSEADIIVGCLAEAPETINLLDAEHLDLCKSGAIIVNVGRGSLIDEDHLIRLLKNDQLAGAFLDVTRTEPLPPDSPLWTIPNLLLSQHTGGGTRDELMDKLKVCVDNIRKYLAGSPENIVRL